LFAFFKSHNSSSNCVAVVRIMAKSVDFFL
jgi:hypothetical protein